MSGTPIAIIRGGTSRGAFFRAEDLPADARERDALLLRAFGADSGSLADGVGGENPVLRKTAIVRALPAGPDGRPMLEYLFGQVDSALAAIDRSVECGNTAAGVPLFGRLWGWCSAEPAGECWILLANTGRRILAQWKDCTDTGGPVRLTFADVAPVTIAEALPSGQPTHTINVAGRDVPVSLVRGLNPYVFIDGAALGFSDPAAQPFSASAFEFLDEIEARARALWPTPVSLLKVCVVAADGAGALSVRIVYVAERRLHPSIAVTGAATLALAGRIPGTVVHEKLRADPSSPGFTVRHAEGRLPIGWSLRADGLPSEVSVDRTCRLILRGTVY